MTASTMLNPPAQPLSFTQPLLAQTAAHDTIPSSNFDTCNARIVNISKPHKQKKTSQLATDLAAEFAFPSPAAQHAVAAALAPRSPRASLELDEQMMFETCSSIHGDKALMTTALSTAEDFTADAMASTDGFIINHTPMAVANVAAAALASAAVSAVNNALDGAAAAAAVDAATSTIASAAASVAAVASGSSNGGLLHAQLSAVKTCNVSLVPVGTSVSSVASRVGPQDFDVLRVVGQGAFGKVFQVSYKGDGQIYAMKVMRKERIVQREHSEYVKSERDVLTAVTHPYIVAMRFSFQTPSKLYLILDFVNGGHLFFNLYKQGVFSEEVARLYSAEIVLAISYLHTVGIVHRDLKPENVLLDCEGHVKITDFGLAKGNFHTEECRTNSFIGTMEYMAPEIILSKGHGKAVDWWSIGILLYEMLCGMPPFRAKSRQALQTQITTSKLKMPKFLSNEAQNLLKGLLNRDVAKRLGAGPGGSDAVKRHPFFRTINWAKLERREVESKFKPAVANSMDIANFDKLWTEQKPEDSPCGTPTSMAALEKHAHLFEGFSYVSPAFINESMERLKLHAANNVGAGSSPTLTQGSSGGAANGDSPFAMALEAVGECKPSCSGSKGR